MKDDEPILIGIALIALAVVIVVAGVRAEIAVWHSDLPWRLIAWPISVRKFIRNFSENIVFPGICNRYDRIYQKTRKPLIHKEKKP